MRTGKGFFRRLIAPGRQAEADVDAELEFHLRTQVDELVESGWDEADATAEVLRRFGDPTRIGVECKTIANQRVDRERRGDMLDAIWSDLRQTWRGLLRRPGFSGLVVLILALGIGGATAMFSVVDGVLLRPLPYPDASELVIAWETDRASGTTREPASIPDYFDFRERNRSFEELAAFNVGPQTLTRPGETPEQLTVAQVTHTFGPVLGLVPRLGRFINADEDVPGAGQVALLSERLWLGKFGGHESALGQSISLDGVLHTVVGVLPREVDFPETPDLWTAAQIDPTSGPRSNHRHTVVGRLEEGVSISMAQSDMTRIAADLEGEYPRDNRERGVNLEPLSTVLFGEVRASLLTVLGAVGLLLLIACVNVANLLLARGARRAREVAVRSAIGASVTRLSRQFLIEGVLLSVAAALLGTLVAVLGTEALLAALPEGLPRSTQVSVDGRILGFTAIVSALVGTLAGLVPALQARKVDVNTVLTREGGRSGGLSRRARIRGTLVVAEIALSVMLVIGAGLLIKSFSTLSAVDPGFRPEQVLKIQYQLPAARYPMDFSRFPDFPEILDFNRTVRTRIEALPGVVSAAVASNHPAEDGFTNSFLIEGREDEFESQAELPMRIVSPGYFTTVGVPLLAGRTPDSRDGVESPGVVVINQAAALRYFPNGDAIGSRIGFWGAGFREVIGIVGNEKFQGLGVAPPPAMYPSTDQLPILSAVRILVRTEGEPEALAAGVRRVFQELDPALALFEIETLDQALASTIGRDRFTALVVSAFAVAALFLALLGIYGLLAYSVAQRTAEIGVRVALGATRQNVARMVIGQGMILVAIGVSLGLAGAIAASRLLSSQLYEISPLDPRTYLVVTLGTLAVSMAAIGVPARKAAGVDPTLALQAE